MRGVEDHAVGLQEGVVGHNGELQHHLVHLAVAVSPHRHNPILDAVEHVIGLGAVVLLRQSVPGAMVEQIPQQQHLIRLFRLNPGHQLGTVVGGAVDIGSNQQFHRVYSPY